MTTPHMTLVITTINVPNLLEEYADNFEKHGHLDHTSAIIVGDKRPAPRCRLLASDLRGRGFDCLYLDLAVQEHYLERFRACGRIPYNSDNRHNIGYLMAVEKGADILVAVDDDNFVRDDDWYTGHAHVGKTQRLDTVSCSNGWFNPCQLIDYEPHCTVYAHGYPYNKRWQPNKETYETTLGRVVLNGGLWLNHSGRGFADTSERAAPRRLGAQNSHHPFTGTLGADQYAEYGLPSRCRTGLLLRAGR